MLLAVEHAPAQRRAWYGSFPQYGTPIGLAGSSLAILLAHAVSGDGFLTWGWRLPFLFSAVLVVVGLWVRARVFEAEEFARVQRAGATVRYPIAVVTRHQWRIVTAGVATTLVSHAGYIVTRSCLRTQRRRWGCPRTGLAALMVSSVTSAVVLAVVGRRADRVDRRRYASIGAVLSTLWVFPAFALTVAFGGPGTGSWVRPGALAALALPYAVLPQPARRPVPGASALHRRLRVLPDLGGSGGGLLPIVASWLVGRSGGDYWPAAALMAAAGAVTAIGATRCRERPTVSDRRRPS